MQHFQSIPLSGAYLIALPAFSDARGTFIKTFQDSILQGNGIKFRLKESYFSSSAKDVIRGMHFQLPPYQHAKIVFCPFGSILDVIVDVRKGSPTFGQYFSHKLSAENHMAYYIPEGFAHGFKALSDGAVTYYLVTSEYSQQHDTGIRYDSIGFDWGLTDPIISQRDLSFPILQNFESPFVFTKG